jgi:AraC-like DNA-binding protein
VAIRPTINNIDTPRLGFAGEAIIPGYMAQSHAHHEIELNYLLAGSMTYETAAGQVLVPARRLTVFWAAVPHRVIRIESQPRFFWFTIPLAWVLNWPLPDRFTAALLRGQFLQSRSLNPGDETMLSRWSADLSRKGDDETQEITLLEMEARLRRLARERRLETVGPRQSRASAGAGRDRVAAMLAFISRRYADPISARDVARVVGLHPNYAATIVRARCGTTLSRLIAMERCFAARRLLVSTRRPVLQIGYDCGFGSVSRFYEAFHSMYGQTPRACRTSAEPS